ncbi:MAG TPA: ComEC/Rec2 family competence protein, partial [Tissierellales bacterium]|nr:ComEC/Rec2 family competence protein [Tissierellales bacterium]
MKKIFKFKLLIVLAIILTLTLTSCVTDGENVSNIDKGELEVHYIDIGQGDSIFIQLPNGETILIDGGPRTNSKILVNYLEELGVENINYLVATHPHEDHIGGLPNVIRNFKVDKIYMPDKTANTAIFEEFLLEIKEKDVEVNTVSGGDVLIEGDGLKYEVMAPNEEKYSNTNDYSIVTKITYKNNSFLFTGDAEKTSEKEIIEKGYKLSSDVLKVGHHGSSTSTSEDFLKNVQPKYGVISCEKGNEYGHPHKEIIKILENYGVEILRTDELGTIVMTSDGKEIKIEDYEDANIEIENDKEGSFIGNKNTKVYHYHNCNYLPNKENQVVFNT